MKEISFLGKTTTTERMLFYSDTIRNVGEVHHGDTVTDYMKQEKDRGKCLFVKIQYIPAGRF